VSLALTALWMGCADFEQAEQGFCDRNPDRCGTSPSYSKLAFTTAPQTVQVGSCSAVTTVQLQDANNSPVSVTADTTVALSVVPPEGFQFFAEAGCTGTAVTSVTIRAGSNSASFYFKGTRTGAATLNASTGSLSESQGVTLPAGPPAAIAMTLPASPVSAGTCTSASIQVKDANGFDTRVGTASSVVLQANPLGGIAFYADAACITPVASVTLPAGGGSVTFYFQGQISGDVTISASSSGLAEDSQVAQVLPGEGNRLVFTSPARTTVAGACSAAVQFQSQDAQGNPAPMTAATTVSLTASQSMGFLFYSDASCSTAVTSLTLPVEASNGSFYFKGTRSSSVTVTLTAPGLTGNSQIERVNPGPPSALMLTNAQRVQAGSCSAAITVELRDAFTNLTTAAANTTVNLTQSGVPTDPTFKFFSDAGCGTVITSVSIPMGQSTARFYYKGERARTVTLTAASTGLTSSTQEQTIVPGNASSLVFSASTPAQTLLAGTCGMRTVESRDAFGNLATNGVTFSISGSTTAEFFQDSRCTASLRQVTIPTGSSSASFYFKGFTGGINANGTLSLTAAATGLTSAAQDETIIPTVRTGSCVMGSTSVTCAITPALLDMSKAFLVFQATSLNTTSDLANVRCFLSSTAQVKCERPSGSTGSADDVNIRWSVAEFPSGVGVQHVLANCTGDTTPVNLPTNVTPDRTFLLLSSQRDVTNMGNSVPRIAVLTSTSQAEIRKTGGCLGVDNNHVQSVDYTGATVQRGLTSLTSGSTSTQVTLPTTMDLSRSILLYSYISDGSGTRICDRVLRGELTDSGRSVTFSRGLGSAASCAGSSFTAISWEVVQFPVGTVVHQVSRSLTSGALSTSTPVQAVDLSRTLVIGGGQWASGQLHGEGLHSTSELISEMRAQAFLSDSTTLNFYRETANNSARFTAYVVQFKP
jgi:hypothetical protein